MVQIKVANKDVNLGTLFPLTIGAMEDLEDLPITRDEKGNIAPKTIKDSRLLVEWALTKCNKDITSDDVRGLELAECEAISQWLGDKLNAGEAEMKGARPTWSSSTSSQPNTDGENNKSEN